jgi:hypothetical protein
MFGQRFKMPENLTAKIQIAYDAANRSVPTGRTSHLSHIDLQALPKITLTLQICHYFVT